MKTPFRFILLLFILSLISHHLHSQTVPTLQCASVIGDSIRITWTVENTNFDSYLLEQSTNVDFLTPALFIPDHDSTSFTHLIPSPFPSTIYYRLRTLDDQGIYSLYSDTIRIIYLSVEPLDEAYSIAALSWNHLHLKDEIIGQYTIYRQASEEDAWQAIGNTLETDFLDTITYPYCSDTLIRYKIEYTDPGANCSSWSSVDSATLLDAISPPAVLMDSVSVSFNGDIVISWQPVVMMDIMAYIIYHDTIPGNYGPYLPCDIISKDTLYFMDTASYARRKSIGYRVTAIDSCGNESLLDNYNPLNTIYLDKILWSYCDTSIVLKWNSAASSMVPPATNYKVFQIDTSTYTSHFLIEIQETQITYETGFKPDSTYCYFVRADNSAGKSSTSCIQCFTVDRPEQPDTLNLRLATVDTVTNSQVSISSYIDTLPDSTTFVLLRRVDINDPYDTIRKVEVETVTTNPVHLTDTSAQVGQRAYYYKAIILDGCGHEAWLDNNRDELMDTNEVRTIYLQGTTDGQVNHLFWNRYSSTTSHVIKYRLIRKLDGMIDKIIPIDFTPDTLYDDPVYDLSAGSGRFSYLVEAVIEPVKMENPEMLSSFSNEIALAQITRINMPNAFTPNNDNENDYFKPVNIFTDQQASFVFLIYNRWGQKIYESTNISDPGWDGTVSGESSPEGVYIYFIRYISSEGEIFEEKGTVTLLR
ncbi:MAG: gliding motility-associated C-terminal domain-containing protein [Bacteroidales bacterium]|nr:gliding motility-associated C-terminal domain-containing protein [Lentimicrobiaceae bacterium]MDD5694799.1 gliding motility-associated C-terminal domain-containing protein [Bacteroidales bacterium]